MSIVTSLIFTPNFAKLCKCDFIKNMVVKDNRRFLAVPMCKYWNCRHIENENLREFENLKCKKNRNDSGECAPIVYPARRRFQCEVLFGEEAGGYDSSRVKMVSGCSTLDFFILLSC